MLRQKKYMLPTYLALEAAEREHDTAQPPYRKIQHPRKPKRLLTDTNINAWIGLNTAYADVYKEFQVARAKRRKDEGRYIRTYDFSVSHYDYGDHTPHRARDPHRCLNFFSTSTLIRFPNLVTTIPSKYGTMAQWHQKLRVIGERTKLPFHFRKCKSTFNILPRGILSG
jgi:hypothetical protein